MAIFLPQSSQQQGFTLVEALVVVAVIAIIGAIAVPPFLAQLHKLEAQMTATEIKSFLLEGKQAAMIYRRPVILCVASSNNSCLKAGGTRLITFVDVNNNRQFDANVDNMLQQRDLSLRFGQLQTSIALDNSYIKMSPDTGNPIGFMGHIRYCPDNQETATRFMVTFSKTGMIKFVPHHVDAVACNYG